MCETSESARVTAGKFLRLPGVPRVEACFDLNCRVTANVPANAQPTFWSLQVQTFSPPGQYQDIMAAISGILLDY